jgi:curved DNA-binding protein CbpA
MVHPAPAMTPVPGAGGPLAGPIQPGVVAAVLRRLYRQRRTGLLHVASGGESCRFCFIQGQIAWGHTTIAECQLGPVLLRHGLIAPEPLEQLVDLMGRGKRMGELLLELGALDRETLDEALILHAREMLLPAFSWPDGEWRFEDQPVEFFQGYDQALRIDALELILDASWCVADPDVVRHHLGDLERRPALALDPARPLAALALMPVDQQLLSLVNGVRSARQVLALMTVPPGDAQRSLFGLLCAGVVELLDPEPDAEPEPAAGDEPLAAAEVAQMHAALATRDHFEVLGLLQSATAEEAAEAAARLVRRCQQARAASPELAPQLDAIVARALEAGRVLGNARRREAYAKALAVAEVKARLLASSPPEPEAPPPPPMDAGEGDLLAPYDALVQAEAEFAEGRYWDALQVVEVLMPGLTGRLRLRAQVLRARIYAKNAKWRHEAEEELKQVVAADPANSDAFFLLGEIYEEAALGGRAAAMYRKVLGLRPRHAGALARLAALGTA